jgi:soluble lytic murein transglycosylase-like protein
VRQIIFDAITAMTAIAVVVIFLTVWGLLERIEKVNGSIDALTRAHLEQVEEEVLYLKILVRKPECDQKVARTIAATVSRHSKDFRRDPDLVLAIIEVESDYLIAEVSTAGAIGLMQVMPQWVEVFGIRCDLRDPDCNVRSGLRLLESYEQLYGDLKIALTVYNRGPSPVDWAFIKGQDPDNGYAGKILKAYEEIQAL